MAVGLVKADFLPLQKGVGGEDNMGEEEPLDYILIENSRDMAKGAIIYVMSLL